jgi:alpha-ketoglutarate-dependent taurine dioxygenase
MAMRVTPADATLGAVVTGVRLAALSDAEWREIEAAFLDRGVLVFPGQHLSRAEQTAFGRRFGELDSLVAKTGTVPISNLRPDGAVRDAADPVLGILRGNEGWHTDSSYMPCSAKASILSAEVPATSGGETEWADMRAALDALDAATRAQIEGLAAYHSLVYSQSKIGEKTHAGLAYGYEGHAAPLRPLVKRHPVTGRSSLFIGRHAYGIPGIGERESEQLLDALLASACQPPRTWTHTWQAGDVAVWDNRCLLHRARPWDPSQPRVMHHTRIAGDPATESGIALAAIQHAE